MKDKLISHIVTKPESAISIFYDFFSKKVRIFSKKIHKKSKKGEIADSDFVTMCEINLSFICK